MPRLHVLGVEIKTAPAPFERTKIVTVVPRFVIINAVGRTLECQQQGFEHLTRSRSDGFGGGTNASDLNEATYVPAVMCRSKHMGVDCDLPQAARDLKEYISPTSVHLGGTSIKNTEIVLLRRQPGCTRILR